MRKLVTGIVAALALVAGQAGPSAEQTKIRIAIWDFENTTEGRWWFHSQMGDAARNQIDNAFSDNAELSRRFTVIEREQLALVLKEQGLATSGAVDPQTAARVGKLLGVRYIVTGGIDKFAINTTRARVGGIGGNTTTAEATISMRFVDATTAERVVSVSADGSVRKGGGFIRGASLSRDDEWGIASEAIQKASEEVVKKFVAGDALGRLSEAAGTGGIDMRVIKVDGNRAYINVGSAAGIKVGDRFTIHRMGEALIDPVTGANLGAEQKQVGTGVVAEVQERFAIITVTGQAAATDVIKKN